MLLYYAFVAVVLLAAVAVASYCRRGQRSFPLWWILFSVIVGLGGIFVPWHTSSRSDFGSGSPIPMVIWERIESGAYIDFPNPFVVVLNPLAVYALGIVTWLATRIWRSFRSVSRKTAQPSA